MRNTVFMSVLEGIERLTDVIESRSKRNQPSSLQMPQRIAGDKFHDENQRVLSPKSVVDRSDIGVLEAGVDLDFPFEGFGLVRSAAVVKQHFHGLDAARHTVFDFENTTHTACAEQRDNLVGPYRISDSKAHSLDSGRTTALSGGSRFIAFLPHREGAGPTLASQV